MKYVTGEYHLHLFDKHGVKIKTTLLPNFMSADLTGREAVKRPPAASYAVTRVITNSIDRAHPWEKVCVDSEHLLLGEDDV